ncbi:MAG: DHHW family protein [Oscillospiraceae bacterium]|nr:DHHW family protein [Oscillospiraceae bacterium]
MDDKVKKGILPELIFTALFLSLIFGFGIAVMMKTPDVLSKSERRELKTKPKISYASVADGSLFKNEEKYLLDQFPLRDGFRRVKAVSQFYLFGQRENNGIFIENGYAAAISYPLTEKSVSVFIKKINQLYERYFKTGAVNVYTTIVPDKAYYLAGESGCPAIDYEALRNRIKSECGGTYIGIFDTLSAESYYRTDTHWRQNRIVNTADRLLGAMGAGKCDNLTEGKTLSPFFGVYYGQSALPLSPDTITYMTSDVINSARVRRADKTTGELLSGRMYYDEYINADDAYDVFLGGACTVTVLDNTKSSGGKTLYLLSDSFGRSLAPLFLSCYKRVVIFDIRYIKMSSALQKISLEPGSDVLMAYSVSAIDVSSNLQTD